MNKKMLELKNITKKFGDNTVLQNVSFELNSGEIHALIGENGAGKTTLIKILTGMMRPDKGRIILNEEDITNKTILERIKKGVSAVYQELDLCPNLTVAENIFLGDEISSGLFISMKQMNKEARALLDKLGVDIDVTKTVEMFPIGIKQLIAIARAVRLNPKVLVLDEPTSSLTSEETKRLFEVVVNLKRQGVGVIFITHFLHQVYELCDKVTIIRDGSTCGTYESKTLNENELLKLMLGKEVDDLTNSNKKGIELSSFIKIENLTDSVIPPFSFDISKGEIVGLAGVISSGVSEIAELIYGTSECVGTIKIGNKVINKPEITTSLKNGIAFLSKDRKEEGIIAGLSVYENMILSLQRSKSFKNIKKTEIIKECNKLIKELNIKVHNIDDSIEKLSGGNQQKVLLARILLTNPKLLILEEPTRGIDIASKFTIWNSIVNLSKKGISILIVSSEIEELIHLCDRILVVNNSKIVADYSGEFNQDSIISSMLGEKYEE